jgi:hypothetical protein
MKPRLRFISVLVVGLTLCSVALAQPTEQIKADANYVDTACTQEAQITGCSDKSADKGLLKCMSHYRKSHKSFKLSPACKAAVQKFHSDKNAGK